MTEVGHRLGRAVRQGDQANDIIAAQLAAQLAEQYTAAAAPLVDAGQLWASALLICSGLDAFAGLYAGRTDYSGTAHDFVSFVKTYLPVFAPPPPGRVITAYYDPTEEDRRQAALRWTIPPRGPVESCAEVLYRGYRCGLIHQGVTSPGLRVVDVAATPVFVFTVDYLNGEVAYLMNINIRQFLDDFLRGIEQYVGDISRSAELKKRFSRRWNMITGPQWTLVPL